MRVASRGTGPAAASPPKGMSDGPRRSPAGTGVATAGGRERPRDGTGERRDLALLVLLGALWGSAFPVIRLGLLTGASPFAFGAARFALAAALMVGVAAGMRAPRPNRASVLPALAFGGLLTIGSYAAFLYTGEETVSGGLSAVLVATVPLWTVLFAAALLPGERLSSAAFAALAVGFVGTLVLFFPAVVSGATASLKGEALVIGASIVGALGAVLVRRTVPGGVDPWTLSGQFVVAAAFLAAIGAVPGAGLALPRDPVTWATLVYLAALPSVAGYSIFFGLVHRGGATRASLVTYLAPVAGILGGIALLDEPVTLSEVAGLAVIVASIALFNRYRRAPAGGGAPATGPSRGGTG